MFWEPDCSPQIRIVIITSPEPSRIRTEVMVNQVLLEHVTHLRLGLFSYAFLLSLALILYFKLKLKSVPQRWPKMSSVLTLPLPRASLRPCNKSPFSVLQHVLLFGIWGSVAGPDIWNQMSKLQFRKYACFFLEGGRMSCFLNFKFH
jgi:hypothetical protein